MHLQSAKYEMRIERVKRAIAPIETSGVMLSAVVADR